MFTYVLRLSELLQCTQIGCLFGVLPWKKVVEELLLLTESCQRKGKKLNSKKTTGFAPANNRIQTTEKNSPTYLPSQFTTND